MIPRFQGRGRLQWRRPGLFLLLSLPIVVAGCDRAGGGPDDRTVQLEQGSVTLQPGAHKHVVRLKGAAEAGEIDPAQVTAAPGDVLVFSAEDALNHSIAFVEEALTPRQLEFLRGSGQLRSPPLLSADARWVVSLDGAPPGDYPFVSALHGGRGRVRVSAPPGGSGQER